MRSESEKECTHCAVLLRTGSKYRCAYKLLNVFMSSCAVERETVSECECDGQRKKEREKKRKEEWVE